MMMMEKSESFSCTSNWIVLNWKMDECWMVDMDKHSIVDHLPHIHYRDLRILDPLYPSAILGRQKAILLNLEHIKAIVTAEEVLVRDPMDENVVPVVEELKRRFARMSAIYDQFNDESEDSEDELTTEFQALEVALESICSFLAARTTELEMATYLSLDKLTKKTSSLNLDRVRKLKNTTTSLTSKVHKVRDELERLLDDDQDMADLYLSRKLLSPVSGSGAANKASISPTVGSKVSSTIHYEENDVKELEMLLEAYFVQIDGTLEKLITLREYIDGTEDYLNIQIDTRRNKLIKLELVLSSGNLCLALFSMVNDIFGLNFPYSWNKNHGFMFKWVIIVTAICTSSLFVTIIAYARRKGLI